MSETSQIILGLTILIMVYFLTRKFHTWRIKKTYLFIIKDLEQKGAFDPPSAVNLPYAKMRISRGGMRDYRPKALEYLVVSNIIGMTDNGKYYLKNTNIDTLI